MKNKSFEDSANNESTIVSGVCDANEMTSEMKSIIEHVDNRNSTEQKFKQMLFVTGGAGTGKSTLLKHIVKNVTNTIVLAPTGLAAMNIGGQTIHSFCQFSIGTQDYKKVKTKEAMKMICKKADLLIFDEISMVRADLFDSVNRFFQLHRENNDFFGGIKILAFGDLLQLPPIVKDDEYDALKCLQYDPTEMYFYNSISVKALDPTLKPLFYELKKVFRQKDEKFVTVLNKIRKGNAMKEDFNFINECYLTKNNQMNNDVNTIILATTNKVVDDENNAKLNNINAKLKRYYSKKSGDFKLDSLPSPEVLDIKVGAKVMITKNTGNCYNGEIYTVLSLGENAIEVQNNRQTVTLEMVKWEQIEYVINPQSGEIEKSVVGYFEQFPCRLGWAMTIHKSQGLTFENVLLDLSRGTFCTGQLYVALSRCTSLHGLRLKRQITFQDMKVDTKVVNFYTKNNI